VILGCDQVGEGCVVEGFWMLWFGGRKRGWGETLSRIREQCYRSKNITFLLQPEISQTKKTSVLTSSGAVFITFPSASSEAGRKWKR